MNLKPLTTPIVLMILNNFYKFDNINWLYRDTHSDTPGGLPSFQGRGNHAKLQYLAGQI